MSLGLPVHLAPIGVARAMARGMHVMALVAILSSLVSVLTVQALLPENIIWPAALALIPLLVTLWILDREATWVATVGYLLIGAASIFWFVLTCTVGYPGATTSDSFIFSMAKIALVLVGGVGVGSFPAVAWSIIGFVLAETATALATLSTNSSYVFDGTTAVALGLVLIVITAVSVNRNRVRLAKPSLHRAARDEYIAHVRQRMEVRAAAMLHDTVLNHLAAVATSSSAALDPDLRARISRDLEVLVGEEWLIEDGADDTAVDTEWQSTRLAVVLADARQLGLHVEVSGDPSVVTRLDADRATAVSLAVKQCLVNVARHSGTDRAEVVVYGSDTDVSIMVIDSGKGFDVGGTATDRLGLRHSIRRRIESVDGSVQVWSTPGRGTSVLLRVPATAAEEVSR